MLLEIVGVLAAVITIGGFAVRFVRRLKGGAKSRDAGETSVQSVSRTDVNRALDDLVAHEEGFRFQSLAVILAQKRWPRLMASEWKRDLGRDAYAPPVGNDPEMALAASTTASAEKIEKDLERIRESRPDIDTLVFYTPQKVTNHTAEQWQRQLAESADPVRLIVVSREDIVTTLLAPENAALCRTHLRLSVPVPAAIRDKLDDARSAVRATVAGWLASPRLRGAPLVHLPLISSEPRREPTSKAVDLETVAEWLDVGQRVLLTAPGGSGKTTTTIQLAQLLVDRGDICFLIDLPQWITSDSTAVHFVCRSQAFLSRNVTASDIARIAEEHHVSWLLNGWNEIAIEDRARATARLRELDRDYPAAGILVATRSGRVSPPLAIGVQVEVQPLTAEQRLEYLNEALGDRGPALSAIITRSKTLDGLTRVPLLLAEVVELHRSAFAIPDSTFGILAAMSARIETMEQHRAQLADAPIHGNAREYLSALAISATGDGGALIPDADARQIVSHVADKLVEDGQLAMRPDPGSVVEELCAHHCLERVEDNQQSVRFQHQRFQEFYAARAIAEWLAQAADDDVRRALEMEVLNRPFYTSAAEMMAEAVGLNSADLGEAAERILIGERLVGSAFAVDPLFGASLARLCGEAVWDRIETEVGGRLREYYADGDKTGRRYALAAMLATGSPDFIDIVEPLLTDDDHQVRLGAYRALGTFHATTLGFDWVDRVSAWPEAQRVEFVVETEWLAESSEIARKMLRGDESVLVRGVALQALLRRAMPELLQRNESIIPDAVLDESLRLGGAPDWYPRSWHDRIAERLAASADATAELTERIRLLLSLGSIREEQAARALKLELEALPEKISRQPTSNLLGEAISVIQRTDPSWTNYWIAERIALGTLSADLWISRVAAITPELRDRLVARVTSLSGEEVAHRGAIELLAKFADDASAQAVLRAIITLEAGEAEAGVTSHKARAETRRRLRDLAVALEPGILASAILETASQPPTARETRVILHILGVRGKGGAEFREELSVGLRERLRRFLIGLEKRVLAEDDYAGELKAGLALAVGRVGSHADADVVERLIRADIERVRIGRAARMRGKRSRAAEGAVMSWSTWHVRALVWLGGTSAVPVLLKLLNEPEYEVDAAHSLVTEVLGIVPVDQIGRVLGFREDDPRVPLPPENEMRIECTQAIAARVRELLDKRNGAEANEALDYRVKQLAGVLAVVDQGEWRDLILEVIALPGEWDMWQRTVALERLITSGERLPAGATLMVVNSVLDRIIEVGIHDQQVQGLPIHLLAVLPFLDDPGRGIARIRQFLEVHRLPHYELRDLIPALGRSKSDEALELLVEMGAAVVNEHHPGGAEWVSAIARVGTPRARRVLLGFVDPDGDERPVTPTHQVSDAVESEIAALAEQDPEVLARLGALSEYDLDESRRTLLAGVLGRIGTQEALLRSLFLVDDEKDPPVPYAVERGLEAFLVERRPHDSMQGSYTLFPRSGEGIRRRLFEFWLADGRRREGAEQLLKSIDEWRLEYGKPSSEPRHPAIDTGVDWPPLQRGR